MSESLKSLIACGTKLWLDSIDPELVQENFALGATGATSNPIIIADLIKTGRFDEMIDRFAAAGHDNEGIAWNLTDELVKSAQEVFQPVWDNTDGNDGYVSFELDPLLEDEACELDHQQRVARYIELGRQWSAGHDNRMIKVPATAAGLGAIEELVAGGVSVNVTLIFSARQYELARDAAWRGAQRRTSLDRFKSVYSIFVSRIDVYTQQHVSQLSGGQGFVGIVNAQRIWQTNQQFWADKNCPLQQEMIFASTGTKNPQDPPWKYVEALAGSDIQTNPPGTNDAIAGSGQLFTRRVDTLPSQEVLSDIDDHVDFAHLETTLMSEGLAKFANPQKALIELIGEKRDSLTGGEALSNLK